VTFATTAPRDAALTRRVLPTTLEARSSVVPGPLRRAALIVGDLLGAVGIALCIPFVILAIGIPLVLCVRLLLWIAGMLF
jgi:hypothetical protein